MIDALTSCILCKIPVDTQFVIIDNGSTDDTAIQVKHFFSKNKYSLYYEKMRENLGVGIGRNYAFSKAKGDYIYFLDDDAYIESTNNEFFTKAINYLETNPSIVTLTTQIYDLVWKANRVSNFGPTYKDKLKLLYMFCGGSHFLRKSFWIDSKPYFPTKYGYEEILPSLRVADAGYVNAFAEDLLVIHNPQVNKWDFDDEKNADIVINELVSLKVMKSKLYPRIFYPILSLSYFVRSIKYLTPASKKEANRLIASMNSRLTCGKKIRASTVIKLFGNFGFSIF